MIGIRSLLGMRTGASGVNKSLGSAAKTEVTEAIKSSQKEVGSIKKEIEKADLGVKALNTDKFTHENIPQSYDEHLNKLIDSGKKEGVDYKIETTSIDKQVTEKGQNGEKTKTLFTPDGKLISISKYDKSGFLIQGARMDNGNIKNTKKVTA